MKKSLIKTTAFVSAVSLVFFVVFSCNKKATSPELNPKNLAKMAMDASGGNPFNRTVGAPIPKETSKRWVENYNRANGGGKFYVLRKVALQAILSDSACVGISLHYALDENGKMHILPIGINLNGRLMRADSIDTQNGPVDWDRAQQWIANHRGEIDSHFFGRNTFERLFSKPCDEVWAMLALNDENQQQLVLSRKIQGEVSPSFGLPDDEDRSAVCPPVCP